MIPLGIELEGGLQLPGIWPWNAFFWVVQAVGNLALGWLVAYQDKLLAESFVIFQNWLAQGGAISPPRDRFMKMSKHRNIQKINNLITTAQESRVG